MPEAGPETDPQALRARLFGVLEQLFVRLADQRPVLLAVEDLHWIDATSHDLLEALVRASSGAALMVLATYRPGYRPPWIGLSYATQQSLQPLGARESLALIRQAGSGAALPAAQVDGILRRGEGNPLFLEELTWAAVEQGEVGNGVEVPATVQTVIAARIDRLSADEKHLLQVAAAGGREAPERLLRAAATLPSEAVGPALATLRHNEWLFASQRGEALWYTFKHALTQDVAYQSLLTGARKALHLRVAAALEQHCPELVAAQPELLAQHLTRAEASARAIVYWQHAGERAMERSANVEAVDHLARALSLLQTVPSSEDRDRQELALQIKLWPALLMTRGYAAPEVGSAYQRVRDLSVQLGKAPQLFSEFGLRLVAGDLTRAHEAADDLLGLGRSSADTAMIVQGDMGIGFTLMHKGQAVEAEEALREGAATYDVAGHHYIAFLQGHDPGAACLIYDDHCLWLLGFPKRALRRSGEAVGLAKRLQHPFTLGMVLYLDAWQQSYYGDLEATLERAEGAMAISAAQGFPFWHAGGTITKGWVRGRRGDWAAGADAIRDWIARWRETGAEIGVPYFFALLVETCLGGRHPVEGMQALAAARALRDKNGEHYWEPELHRLEGELHLAASPADPDAAERCFERALSVAREQAARSLELRAATSLARLLGTRGGSEQRRGRTRLAEVYAWFTEGHDTADLVAAKTLLDALHNPHPD